MNDLPPGEDPPDDLDDRYRSDSMRDPSRPSERVRRAVLEHAAHLAAERVTKHTPVRLDFRRRAANQAGWRPAILGTLAAAALAGLLVAPRFLLRAPEPAAQLAQAPPPAAPKSAVTAQVPAAEPAPRGVSAETSRQGRLAGVPASPPAVRGGEARPESALNPDVAARNSQAAADSYAANEFPRPAEGAGPSAAPNMRSPARRLAPPSPGSTTMSVAPPLPPAAPMAQAVRPDPAAALRQAAESGDLPRVQALLGTGIDIDARDSAGRTALMLATLHGQAPAVDALLARGANPNATDAQGLTPLQAALAGNEPAIAAALQRAGAR